MLIVMTNPSLLQSLPLPSFLWVSIQFGEALKHFLNQREDQKAPYRHTRLKIYGEMIMGKTIARYTESLRVIDKTLFITTNVAPLKQELVYQKEKIKLRINEALGDKTIEEIVIQ